MPKAYAAKAGTLTGWPIGYPYGLIEADRIARVRDEEIEPFRIQLLSALSGLGSWSELEAFIHATDAHSVIDEI